MIIQYVSDIHLELRPEMSSKKFERFINERIKPIGDILCLLGDIGNPYSNNYELILEWSSRNFKQVFVIAGNHEFYTSRQYKTDVNERLDILRSKVNNMSNVVFLENEVYEFEGVMFLGCTLWSNVEDSIEDKMNDYKYIMFENRGLEPNDTRLLHSNSVKFLTESIEMYKDKNIVVLTHHLPTLSVVKNDDVKSAYGTDLDILKQPVKIWLSGHYHSSIDKMINGVYFGVNCIGYVDQKISFSKEKTISF